MLSTGMEHRQAATSNDETLHSQMDSKSALASDLETSETAQLCICLCLVLGATLLSSLLYFYIFNRERPSGSDTTSEYAKEPISTLLQVSNSTARPEACKRLYHELQNLEFYPNIRQEARHHLLSLLYEALLIERYQCRTRSLLDIEIYDRAALQGFLSAEMEDTLMEWERYHERRASGGPTELFEDDQQAREWLTRQAPLNFVDGAWISHVHKSTTPFVFRNVTKGLWQTYSEEAGDGDLEKNHIWIYQSLLKGLGVDLPPSAAATFFDESDAMDDEQIWKAAMGQLLISLFPHDFLPEILGFNMHFERLSVKTLKAARELPEFGISGYYYSLHVSIDNAASGHSAMALTMVDEYMSLVKLTGTMDTQEAWKRIQAGYLLSQRLDDETTLDMYTNRFADMVLDKADVSGRIHCTSRVRIGSRSLANWLSHIKGQSDTTSKLKFLDELADATPWVKRGDSSGSLIMREIFWKGKMFGAFTTSEVKCFQAWIDSLPTESKSFAQMYLNAVGHTGKEYEETPELGQNLSEPLCSLLLGMTRVDEDQAGLDCVPWPSIDWPSMSLTPLLCLWFVHPCLLENMAASPSRLATRMGSYILQLLGAEHGFQTQGSGVTGLDKIPKSYSSPGIIDLGLEIMRRNRLPEPSSLDDLLNKAQCKAPGAVSLSRKLQHLAMFPLQNGSFLIGLARAFLDLEVWVSVNPKLLSSKGRTSLMDIIKKKEMAFELCWKELRNDPQESSMFRRGYEVGRRDMDEIML